MSDGNFHGPLQALVLYAALHIVTALSNVKSCACSSLSDSTSSCNPQIYWSRITDFVNSVLAFVRNSLTYVSNVSVDIFVHVKNLCRSQVSFFLGSK